MAKKNGNGASALAVLEGNDELAGVLGDLELDTDGLEETDGSDRRISALVFNFKGTTPDGEPIPANAFFDTVTEEVSKKKRLALLTVHKSNAWSEFDQAEGRTKMRCRSWDRVTGEMEDGRRRSCDGCPDKQWRRDPDTGKRSRNCADVHNVVAVDLDDGQPKIIRCKKTSERPWKDYLNRHFFGKRIVNGVRKNFPLFARETVLSLEMVKGGANTYAVPKFEPGQVFSKEEIVFFAESARAYREVHLDDVRKVAEGAPDDGDAPESDPASFDPNEFSDDAGATVEASPNRF